VIWSLVDKKKPGSGGGDSTARWVPKRKKRRSKLSLREGLRIRRRPAPPFIRALLLGTSVFFAPPHFAAADPQKIVSLTPSVTETLFALGAGDQVIGVSRYCDYPPEARTRDTVGTFLAPVVEAVVALAPDLVLTSPSPGNQEPVVAMERLGLRVVTVPEGSASVSEVLRSIQAVAAAVGATHAADRIIDGLERDLTLAEAKAEGRPRVATAVVVGHEPLVLAGPQSYLGELIVHAGGSNVADPLGGKWPRAGLEFLVAAKPEVIVDLSMGSEASSAAERWRRLEGVPAVKAGRVYFDASLVLLHPGPRIGSQAVLLSRFLHPESWQASSESKHD
jgi:iron complex transport system substrate-binding protein